MSVSSGGDSSSAPINKHRSSSGNNNGLAPVRNVHPVNISPDTCSAPNQLDISATCAAQKASLLNEESKMDVRKFTVAVKKNETSKDAP